jgi:hypothetical protein
MSDDMRSALLLVVLGAAACSVKTAFVHPDLAVVVHPASAPVRYRLILVGDAGEPKEPEPVLDAVRVWAMREPDKTLVMFLGDNAYPRGSAPGNEEDSARRLRRQAAAVVGTGAEAVFVPGNHDWAQGGVDGLSAITRQAEILRGLNTPLRPTAGCPGPEYEDRPAGLRPVVRVVFLDTQWWLHEHAKGTGCTPGTQEAVVAALQAALSTPMPIVVAAHHPLATHGRHGGFYDWKAHLSLYPLVRRYLIRRPQDLAGQANASMRAALAAALDDASPAVRVYAAGHEHSLQVLAGDQVDYVLVSGGGSSRHSTAVGKGPDTLYAHRQAGFMVLDVTDEGLRLSVVEPSASVQVPVVAWLGDRSVR